MILDQYFANLTKHMMYSWEIAQVLGGGVNSYAHYDIEFLEHGHELGLRVWHAMEEEAQGFGAIFDLQYEQWMKDHEQG